MTLYEAVKLYSVYLQGLHLSAKKLSAYHRTLSDILSFYGEARRMDAFNEPLVLEYAAINDPFDCDPIHEERGTIFCAFVHWLMVNHMIPAWSSAYTRVEQ